MDVLETSIKGVNLVDLSPIVDPRGSFVRYFCEKELDALLCGRRIVQANHSRTTRKGAVRGLHYQCPPVAEMKIVRCIRGAVLDVAVDLRKGSASFLAHHAEELTAENYRMLVIPEGCAHGFQALSDDVELLYLHTQPYTPELEAGIAHDDSLLGIRWPLPVVDLSPRDAALESVTPTFEGIEV